MGFLTNGARIRRGESFRCIEVYVISCIFYTQILARF